MKINYKNVDKWVGTRNELIELINKHEKLDPQLMLRKKVTKEAIPLNLRRLNTFSAAGIFPKELEDRQSGGRVGWELKFSAPHYYRYSLAIRLRKEGYKLENASKIMQSLSDDEVRDRVKNWGKSTFENDFSSQERKRDVSIAEELKRLGRVDGRVLHSTQLRFAVTPWFHVYVSERELKKMSKGDIGVLTSALASKLSDYKENMKNK